MRDIRSDLEERAHIVQEQVRVAYAHFERMAQQMQSERDARVADLKGSLAMIEKLIQFETGIMGNVVTLENAERIIRHALKLTEPHGGKVAMLLPMQYDCAKGRVDLFENPPFKCKLTLLE